MVLSAGTRIGSYEILAPIGAGGMGEVYRARDTKLEREVAVKVHAARVHLRHRRESLGSLEELAPCLRSRLRRAAADSYVFDPAKPVPYLRARSTLPIRTAGRHGWSPINARWRIGPTC